MTDRRWLFEGQVTGTVPSTSNTKSESGEDLSTVSPGTGGTVVYDDVWSFPSGGKSLKTTNGTGAVQIRHAYANSHSAGAIDVAFRITAEVPESRLILRLRHAGGYIFSVGRNTSGRIFVQNATGTIGTGTVTMPFAVRFGITYTLATGAASTVTVRTYNEAGTLLETQTFSNVDLGATSYVATQIEVVNSGTTTGYNIWYDSPGLRDGAATLMGPPASGGAAVTGLVLTATGTNEFTLSWLHPSDAPSGLSVVRAAGTQVNDGLGRAPGSAGYDPMTITGASIIATGETASPYVDSGLSPGTYTYWLVRTG